MVDVNQFQFGSQFVRIAKTASPSEIVSIRDMEDMVRLKISEWKLIYYTNSKHKKTGLAILNQTDAFQTRSITGD